MDDDAIRMLVTRLSRPHSSGGKVIERAAILAEGADSAAVLTWIVAHAGEPEDRVAGSPGVASIARGTTASEQTLGRHCATCSLPGRCHEPSTPRADRRFRPRVEAGGPRARPAWR